MNIILINANPNPHSLTHSFTDHIKLRAEEKGHKVVIRDLYEMKFDAILGRQDYNQFLDGVIPSDIRKEHEIITESDMIVFLYPIWWAGPPAILKGYIDRVILKNFAYDKHPDGTYTKRLTDKKAMIINTMGASEEAYKENGFLDAMTTVMDKGVLDFVGLQNAGHHFFGDTENLNADRFKSFISRLDDILEKVL
mgnify:FL=1